jgi:hypothetical protein
VDVVSTIVQCFVECVYYDVNEDESRDYTKGMGTPTVRSSSMIFITLPVDLSNNHDARCKGPSLIPSITNQIKFLII